MGKRRDTNVAAGLAGRQIFERYLAATNQLRKPSDCVKEILISV